MAATSSSNPTPELPLLPIANLSRKQWIVIFVALALALFAIFGWLWYDRLYSTPERVFWSMIDNTLATRGVTRTITEEGNGGSSEQVIRLSFNGDTRSHGLTTVTQKGSNGQNTLAVTETIGTPAADYIRYTQLDAGGNQPNGKKPDFSSVINQWSKAENKGASNFLDESLYGLVPVANLLASERQRLLTDMKARNVYTVDFSNVTRTPDDGPTYVYSVAIDLQQYLLTLQDSFKVLGLQTSTNATDPSQYAGQSATVNFQVDVRSRQLRKVTYATNPRTEKYSSYGVVELSSLPTNTISVADLQQRIQSEVQ